MGDFLNTGCRKKVTKFQTEIALEIFGRKNQFRYFWKAEMCSCLAGLKNIQK